MAYSLSSKKKMVSNADPEKTILFSTGTLTKGMARS